MDVFKMFTKKFTVSGSSLELLKPGEQGIVTDLRNADQLTKDKLMAMGIIPGVSITLEQRLPELIVKVGQSKIALTKQMSRSIYVRIYRTNK